MSSSDADAAAYLALACKLTQATAVTQHPPPHQGWAEAEARPDHNTVWHVPLCAGYIPQL